MSEVNVLTRTDRGDSLAKHIRDKHFHMHRGALWVSVKGTPFLCMFGNDNYERPRTKSYVDFLKSTVEDLAEVIPNALEHTFFGVDDETGTWVIATRVAGKKKQSLRVFLMEISSKRVWNAWNAGLELMRQKAGNPHIVENISLDEKTAFEDHA